MFWSVLHHFNLKSGQNVEVSGVFLASQIIYIVRLGHSNLSFRSAMRITFRTSRSLQVFKLLILQNEVKFTLVTSFKTASVSFAGGGGGPLFSPDRDDD